MLRDLAESPKPMAELEVHEGVISLTHRDQVPERRHADPPGSDQCSYVRHPASARWARRRRGASSGRQHACRSGDHPLHGRVRRRQLIRRTGGARRRFGWAPLCGQRRHHLCRARFSQAAHRVHRKPPPVSLNSSVWLKIPAVPGATAAGPSDTPRCLRAPCVREPGRCRHLRDLSSVRTAPSGSREA